MNKRKKSIMISNLKKNFSTKDSLSFLDDLQNFCLEDFGETNSVLDYAFNYLFQQIARQNQGKEFFIALNNFKFLLVDNDGDVLTYKDGRKITDLSGSLGYSYKKLFKLLIFSIKDNKKNENIILLYNQCYAENYQDFLFEDHIKNIFDIQNDIQDDVLKIDKKNPLIETIMLNFEDIDKKGEFKIAFDYIINIEKNLHKSSQLKEFFECINLHSFIRKAINKNINFTWEFFVKTFLCHYKAGSQNIEYFNDFFEQNIDSFDELKEIYDTILLRYPIQLHSLNAYNLQNSKVDLDLDLDLNIDEIELTNFDRI